MTRRINNGDLHYPGRLENVAPSREIHVNGRISEVKSI